MLRRPGGDWEMVDILSLAEGVATKTHVLDLLHRLVDAKTIPQALILSREPKANVGRYDGLRAQIARGSHA